MLVLLAVKLLCLAFSNWDVPLIILILKWIKKHPGIWIFHSGWKSGKSRYWFAWLLAFLTESCHSGTLIEMWVVCVPVVKQNLNQKPSRQPISSQTTSAYGLICEKSLHDVKQIHLKMLHLFLDLFNEAAISLGTFEVCANFFNSFIIAGRQNSNKMDCPRSYSFQKVYLC